MIAGAAGVALGVAVGGCQSYERSALDLGSHRAAFEGRLDDGEAIAAFAARLGAEGEPAPTRFDLSDGLSLAEGEVVALFFNADLRLARLEAGVALATAETAGLWADPTFGFDGAEILSPAGLFEYGLTIGLTLPVSGRLAVERDRAEALHETELRRVVDLEWTTRARTRSAWSAWTVARERTRLLDDVVEQVERVGALTGRLEEAGELTRVEGRLLRAQLVELRAEVVEARLVEERARVELLGLLGLAAGAGVELVPSLASVVEIDVGDGVGRLIAANTTLAVRRAAYRAAEETLRLEIREQYPDIRIGTGYGSEEGDDRLLLGVSVPIPILNANRGGIARARARREVARAAAETTFEGLTRELALAEATLDATRARRRAFETELVPMLDEQAGEVERLAELGEVDTLILLQTVTRGYDAKRRLLDLRLAEVNALIERARLLGPDEAWAAAGVDVVDDQNGKGVRR